MAFDILTRDSLRRTVESATGGENTVLYDAFGNASFMAVIPYMTIGDVFPAGYGSNIFSGITGNAHPAFLIYEDEYGDSPHIASEIFISLYNNTMSGDIPCSIPGAVSAQVRFQDDDTDLRDRVHSKGDKWHIMNIWEYSLLQMWSAKQGYIIEGDDGRKVSDTGHSDGGSPPFYPIEYDYESLVSSQTGKYYLGKFSEDIDGIFIDGEEIFVFETDPRVTEDPLYVGRGFLEYARFQKFIEDRPDYVLMLIDEPFGDFEYNYYVMGSQSKAVFQLNDIFNRPREGVSSNDWRHNHSFSGVWGLNNDIQIIDGIQLRNNLTTKEKKIFITPGNYFNWTEDLMMFSGASLYGYAEPYEEEIFIGEPGLESDYGIFTFPGQSGVGTDVQGYPLQKDADFDSNVSLADRQVLALLGFPPYNITALETAGMGAIESINRAKIFTMEDDNFETYFLTKNFRRPLLTSVQDETHWSNYVTRNMWNNLFYTTSNSGSVRAQTFRTCYAY